VHWLCVALNSSKPAVGMYALRCQSDSIDILLGGRSVGSSRWLALADVETKLDPLWQTVLRW
jgi:hypothetical protein